jgi:hypothetical protein
VGGDCDITNDGRFMVATFGTTAGINTGAVIPVLFKNRQYNGDAGHPYYNWVGCCCDYNSIYC